MEGSSSATALPGGQQGAPGLAEATAQQLSSPPPPPPPIDDPLVNGIKTLFDPTIKQTTEKLLQVHKSQLALSDELDRLIAQLQNYLDNSEPPSIRPTVLKLAATSKKLAAVNAALQNIQQRLNKLFLQLSKHRTS
ncbi:hypothetical protein BDZ91DRAFT_354494 [Kalaharituber pfeilii]|nr:hypothetical protein BDZ91DRAFT_354494 [Kalaharituber pfeilii]